MIMRRNIHKQNQYGFTLMEVMIVLFLFSVLLLGLMNIFEWHQKVYMLEQADVLATGSVRTAMNAMTRSIAQGTQIMASRTIAGQTYNSGAGAIIVELPSINASGAIIANTHDYVTYYVTGDEMYQVVEKGAGSVRSAGKKQLSSDMETLTFTYNSTDVTAASVVTIDMKAKATVRGASTVSAAVSDTVILKNR